MFPVFTQLTLQDIIIDAADSILPNGNPCLSTKSPCCYVNNSNLY